MANERGWWFCLISALPDPEVEEQVTVALLFGNGRVAKLEFEPSLPRLKCLVPPSRVALFRDVLMELEKRVQVFESLESVEMAVGPMLAVSRPRGLFRVPDRATVSALRKTYLTSPRRTASSRERTRHLALVDRLLEGPYQKYGFGVSRLKRPQAAELYPRASDRIRAATIPRLDRAFRSSRRDLLVGGVSVTSRAPTNALRNPGVRLGKAFWAYRTGREAIREVEGRDLRTVGLVFARENGTGSDVAEVAAYLKHVWAADADCVIDAREASAEATLGEQLEWVADSG